MFKEIFLQMLSGAISASLRLLLVRFRELNGDVKAKQLNDSFRNGFLLLKDVANKTKGKLDDTAVNIFLAAVD